MVNPGLPREAREPGLIRRYASTLKIDHLHVVLNLGVNSVADILEGAANALPLAAIAFIQEDLVSDF